MFNKEGKQTNKKNVVIAFKLEPKTISSREL